MFAKELPRDALGNLKRIEIPQDRGEEGRPGALKGRRQQSQDPVEAKIETESVEGNKGLKPRLPRPDSDLDSFVKELISKR